MPGKPCSTLRISSASQALSGLRHCAYGLELEEHVGFVQAHRVQAQFVRTHPRHHVVDFRHLRLDRTSDRQVQLGGTLQRDRR